MCAARMGATIGGPRAKTGLRASLLARAPMEPHNATIVPSAAHGAHSSWGSGGAIALGVFYRCRQGKP